MPIEVHPDADALARVAAERVIEAVRAGAGRMLLAGGSTPARTYELIARMADPADLRDLHLFFGDERAVPPDHADSNYGMVKRAWLDPARFPPERVHRIRGELDAERAARLAEEELRGVTGEPPSLDLALLGLGADGHTASLFPGDAALTESVRLYAPAREGQRITATLGLLAEVNQVIFLVSGAEKARAVKAAVEGSPGAVPASLVQPGGGPATWLLDTDAASRLS